MPYVIGLIIAVASATVLILSRFETDESYITEELNRMEVMFSMIDSSVNAYIELGESITDANFEVLRDSGVLLPNSFVTGVGKASVLTLPNNTVVWQLIPNKDDSSSYKLLVDMRQNFSLMSKSRFSESFIGREFCENDLFGTFETDTNSYVSLPVDEEDFVDNGGSRDDGVFACIVFK